MYFYVLRMDLLWTFIHVRSCPFMPAHAHSCPLMRTPAHSRPPTRPTTTDDHPLFCCPEVAERGNDWLAYFRKGKEDAMEQALLDQEAQEEEGNYAIE